MSRALSKSVALNSLSSRRPNESAIRLRWTLVMRVPGSQDDDTNRVSLAIFIGVALVLLIIWLAIRMGPGSGVETRPGDVTGKAVFVGSSTIARFPLDQLFPNGRVANLGKADENAVDLRERLAREL